MTHEWADGAIRMNHQNYPVASQEAGLYGVVQGAQSQEIYSNDRYQLSDGSVQSSPWHDHGSLQSQRSIHEALLSSAEHSFNTSASIQSCSSDGSPLSPQNSQSYLSDSLYFHLPGEPSGPAVSGYGGIEKEVDLKRILQELETALLSPDCDDRDKFEAVYEEHRPSAYSEGHLEPLLDAHDNCYRSSSTVYCQTEKSEISSMTHNCQRLTDSSAQSVKSEIMNETHPGVFCFTSESGVEEQKQVLEFEIPYGDVRLLLIACAKAISDSNSAMADSLIAELRQVVSICGDPMQRLGAYMLEGLVARLASSGGLIYKASRCKEQPASGELLSYMQTLYEVCPYFKFGYMAANGAIAEAFKDEEKVHIIDFQIAQGSQWVTLIQALAARPGGSPHVRITGVDDPVSEYARGGGLQLVGQRLSKLAEILKVPFEFHAVPVLGPEIQVNMLEVRPGDTLVVNFALQLHHMPDESVSTSNHRDRLLRMVKGLSPKVLTLVEQEANTNTAPFLPRFIETLSYYSAVFESLDVTLPRESKERISVEQHCLACDIVNIIACEGAERVERHEVLGKWRSRLTMAGFKPYPLSSIVNSTIKSLLESYCENYSLVENDSALYLGWLNRPLITASAWK